MKIATKQEMPAYDALCDRLRKLAESERRDMSEAEIHKSARNLMGYVELMLKLDRKLK